MKRLLSTLTAAALAATALAAVPTGAQAAPGVPPKPHIIDVAQDANHHSSITGQSVGLTMNGADILAVWFTEDANNVYTNIQTTNGARPESLTFIVYMDPNKGAECLQLRTTTGGLLNDPFSSVNLTADCGTAGTTTVGEVTEAEGPDGTSILTSSFPKKDVPLLANGTTLKAPNALVGYNAHNVSARAGIIDDTAVGTDYKIGGGASDRPQRPKVDKPKPKPKPKPKAKKLTKKACLKLKGKARKKCLKKLKAKKKPARCSAYKPGELGAEAKTIVVTDAATEAKPAEVTLDLGPGLGQATGTPVDAVTTAAQSHAYYNVQVDSKNKDAGLFVSLGSPVPDDNDLYLLHSTGNEAAHAAGFHGGGPVPIFDSNADGGHTGPDAEFLDGIRTVDCGGYTVHAVGANSRGGAVPLKFWLGPASDYEVPAP
jgi:hypothetical protein